MTKYAGPFPEVEAGDRAEATCRARARQLSSAYPIPSTANDVVGGIFPSDFFTNTSKYATHRLTGPLKRVDTDDYYLEVTPEIEGLPAGTEPVRGFEVPVTRTGVVITDFRVALLASEEPRAVAALRSRSNRN